MSREELHAKLKQRVIAITPMLTTQVFIEDLERLFLMDSDQSIQGITASIWLEKLNNLSDDKLTEYIQNYKKDLLNPFDNELCQLSQQQ